MVMISAGINILKLVTDIDEYLFFLITVTIKIV